MTWLSSGMGKNSSSTCRCVWKKFHAQLRGFLFYLTDVLLRNEQKDATVGEMRKRLEELTDVQSKRQKIIGLGKKPNPSDEQVLQDLSLKNPHSFMMVRT